MKRCFCYSEPGGERGEYIDIVYVTEEELRDWEYPMWLDLMVNVLHKDKSVIDFPYEKFLETWIIEHDAWTSVIDEESEDHNQYSSREYCEYEDDE